MKEKRLFDLIGDVDDKLVDEAKTAKSRNKVPLWKKITAVAACAAIVAGSVTAYAKLNGGNKATIDNHGGAQAVMPSEFPTSDEKGKKSDGIKTPPADSSSAEKARPILDVVFPKAYAFEDVDARIKTFEDNPVDESFVKSVKNFSYLTASNILNRMDGNSNYSPLSLYYALAVAATGANGKTQEELLSVLGVKNKETLSKECGNLYRRLYIDNESGKVKIANSLWLDKQVEWKNDYIKNAAENFYASVFSENFADGNTASKISNWIAENTNGTLAPEIELMPNEIMTILNTTYFKASWSDEFFEENTKQDSFYLDGGAEIKCDFMNRVADSTFAKGDGFIRSSLGFANHMKMEFVLPDEGVSVESLLSSPEKLKEALEGGTEDYGIVTWSVPKFGYDSSFNLVDTLKKSGVNHAFSDEADFSGITDNWANIGNITQGTHIAVDERGVEASAYTMIDVAGTGAPTEKVDMILNRPFLYAITTADNTPLFIGVCGNPTA